MSGDDLGPKAFVGAAEEPSLVEIRFAAGVDIQTSSDIAVPRNPAPIAVPFCSFLAFCETTIQDRTNQLSIIKVIDNIELPEMEPPYPVSGTMVFRIQELPQVGTEMLYIVGRHAETGSDFVHAAMEVPPEIDNVMFTFNLSGFPLTHEGLHKFILIFGDRVIGETRFKFSLVPAVESTTMGTTVSPPGS